MANSKWIPSRKSYRTKHNAGQVNTFSSHHARRNVARTQEDTPTRAASSNACVGLSPTMEQAMVISACLSLRVCSIRCNRFSDKDCRPTIRKDACIHSNAMPTQVHNSCVTDNANNKFIFAAMHRPSVCNSDGRSVCVALAAGSLYS